MDSKGRIQIPKKIRQELGIREAVTATIENGTMNIEPVEKILDRLSGLIRFKYASIETILPELRKVAEKQLMKEVS